MIRWKDTPDEHDLPAAASYLGLLFHPALVDELIDRFKHTHPTSFKSKDIIRASRHPFILDRTNRHVAKNLEKIRGEIPLSPILLVRHDPLIIADGYHRTCAIWLYDEDEPVPCLIVNIPAA